MIDVIILFIVVIMVVVGIISSKGHFKGQGGCCGGNDKIKKKRKKLNNPIIKTKEFGIIGMHCDNCVRKVENDLNDIEGIKAKVSLKKNNVKIDFEKNIEDNIIIERIKNLGFDVENKN